LKDFSKVGESVVRHGHSQPLEIKFALTDLMIEWTGFDHMLEQPMQKHVVLLVVFVAGIVISLFECFGFSCVLQSLEVLWADFVCSVVDSCLFP